MKDEFHPLRVAATRRETADAISYALAVPPELGDEFRHKPGQHLVVRAMIDGAEVRRTYSISSGPEDRELWITVKRVDGGLFSGLAHESIEAGSTIEAMAPSGRFTTPAVPGDGRTYLAIAAGSGITPVMGMIRHVLATEPSSRFVLVYGNRSADNIIFRDALEDLKDRHLDRLMLLHILSRDTDADADVPLLAGRIDAGKLAALAPVLPKAAEIDHVFLCGPGSVIKDAREALLAMGVPRERIHFEYFRAGSDMTERRTTAKPAAATAPAVGAEVVAIVDGARHTFRVAPGGHIVDSALAAGVRVPYSCKGGMCCTCRAKLVEGQVTMDRNFSLEPWELEAGFVLTCQSRPATDRVVVDYDQM